MPLSQMLLPEFDHEMQTTRKLLERVPDGRPEWKPHAKSMTLARLAGHVAELPFWGVNALELDRLDIDPPGGRPFEPGVMKSHDDLLATFDGHVKQCRAALATASDEHLSKPWSLLKGGATLVSMPRLAILRNMVLNHTIHHRAQLGVYLRLLDVPLPQSYGSSADAR